MRAWRGLSSISTVCSVLGGSSVSTASFVRRRMSGAMRRRRVASSSGASPLSMGLRKVSLNRFGSG